MKETIYNLKKVYEYGKKYRKNLFVFVSMSGLFTIINIILPIIAAKQIVYLSDNLYIQLIKASAIIMGIEIISAIFHLILRRNTQMFFRGTTKNIQLDASKEILKLKLDEIDKRTSGTFIQRINNDTDDMSRVFTRGMAYLRNIISDIGIFGAIFIINKIVFLYFVAGFIILSIFHLYKVRKVNEEDRKYRRQSDKTNGLISELVRGIRDIKMLNAKDSFVNEIEDNIDGLTESIFDMRNVEMNYDCSVLILSSIIQYGLIVLLAYLLFNSYITVASALILYNYKSRILSNLMEHIGKLLLEIKGFNLSCSRVFALLNNDEFEKEEFGNERLNNIKGNFEFKNVRFAYSDNQVLNGLSFKIKENETIAFVGKSGAGKTTIFSLLCKLYDIQDGEILLDGKNIKDLDEYSIRNNITIISQNPYIFNMSIRDNLKLVKENLDEEEMKEACKLACLDEFIESLPNKYDTVVGEGGVSLSGGQRQRLAIARAFVQNTKIIFFDEATSALDNETQGYIQKAIKNMKDRYTILIIAHRLSTIVNSDRIMLVDAGEIIDSGTHEELLCNNKIYKKLYESELLEK